MSSVSPIVVVGQGWVGRRLVGALRSADILTSSWSPTAHETVADRERSLQEVLAVLEDPVVVNAAGLLHGAVHELEDANVAFAAWLAELVSRRGLALLHLGSAAEYGHPPDERRVAESTPCMPTTDYGRTKLAGTLAVIDRVDEGMATVARVFNLVGPGAPPGSPIAQFAEDVAALGPLGGAVEVRWPDTVRDVISVDQLARSLIGLSTARQRPPVVNVCSGAGVRFGSLVESLGRRRGVEVQVVSLNLPGIPAVVGDPTILLASTGSVPRPLGPDGIAAEVWTDGMVQSVE